MTAAVAAIAKIGLAALRQDEIVGVLPVPRGEVQATLAGLERAWTGPDQVTFAVGVSTVHAGPHGSALLVGGNHRDTPSIRGALVSVRRAADAIPPATATV